MKTDIFTFFEKRVGLKPTQFQSDLFCLFKCTDDDLAMPGPRGSGRTTGVHAIALYAAMHGLKVCVTKATWQRVRDCPLYGSKNITVVPYTRSMRGYHFDLLIMDDMCEYDTHPDILDTAGRVICV